MIGDDDSDDGDDYGDYDSCTIIEHNFHSGASLFEKKGIFAVF